MTTPTRHSVRRLALAALLLLPACDGGKTEAKPDEPAAEAAKPAKPERSAVAELDGDGRVEIEVDASGYHPAEIRAPAKANVTLAFKRTTDQGCGQKVVVASLSIEKDLPLDEVVEIPVVVPEAGELGFACGMNMYKGKVVPKS
jgi:plastocyanin domain-containing protein